MSDFKWFIEKMVVAEGNVVTQVYWRCEAQGFACSGIRNLVRSDNFTEYEKLTEQQVLDWCFELETITLTDIEGNKQFVSKLLKNDGETQVAEQINRVKNEPALPWV